VPLGAEHRHDHRHLRHVLRVALTDTHTILVRFSIALTGPDVAAVPEAGAFAITGVPGDGTGVAVARKVAIAGLPGDVALVLLAGTKCIAGVPGDGGKVVRAGTKCIAGVPSDFALVANAGNLSIQVGREKCCRASSWSRSRILPIKSTIEAHILLAIVK
jgi:hypothetical protein